MVGPVRFADRAPLLRPGWIVYGLFVLNPLFWAMGFGGFIWALASIPLVTWMLLRTDLKRPTGLTLFIIYVMWAGFSIIMVDSFTRLLAFGLRYGVYITSIGLAIYVYNESRVRRTTFIDWVAVLWLWAIIGGYLGLLLPRTRLNITLASLVLPRAITSNEFVGNLVRPRFAQVQDIFGVSVPRPATLWAFTNEWGGNVGLLTPFFIAATLYSLEPWRKRAGVIGLVVAAPVMILSVDRGLWLSIGMLFAVLAVRSFLAGHTAPIKVVAGGVIVVAVLVVLTPIGSIVSGRLSESSADSRAGIYQEAWDGALESPLLGRGGRARAKTPTHPPSAPTGTCGSRCSRTVWWALVSTLDG